jgi:hypothetical protein
MSQLTWVLESEVFPLSHPPLREAIVQAGHRLVDWDDAWWNDGMPLGIADGPTLFHGSLGNASAINDKLGWLPGSFCTTASFHCSAWYETAREWLLHSDWRVLSAADFVTQSKSVTDELGCEGRVFVRPDSPLKPFSGRVINTDSITLRSLDYEFYFDDESLPVVVAPIREVGREWRFVVARSIVVAGSAYDAATRSAIAETPDSGAWSFANLIASALPPPAAAYILDVCECDGELKLLELNPFGGADLYACDSSSVVQAVTDLA